MFPPYRQRVPVTARAFHSQAYFHSKCCAIRNNSCLVCLWTSFVGTRVWDHGWCYCTNVVDCTGSDLLHTGNKNENRVYVSLTLILWLNKAICWKHSSFNPILNYIVYYKFISELIWHIHHISAIYSEKNALPLVTIPLKNSHKYLIKKSKTGPTLCCEKLLEIWVGTGFRLLRDCSDEVRRVTVQEHTVQELRYFSLSDLCKWWEPWRTEMKTAKAVS